MEEVIKVAFIGIVGVVAAGWFKAHKPEYGTVLILAIGFLLFGFVYREISVFFQRFSSLAQVLGESAAYLNTLIKVVGITYICEFAASLCKDSGYQTLAGQIEILGKLTIVLTGLPILMAVVEQIRGLL